MRRHAAKMLENNPALMQLRMIQAVNESTGNTIVLNVPKDADAPAPRATTKTKSKSKGSTKKK